MSKGFIPDVGAFEMWVNVLRDASYFPTTVGNAGGAASTILPSWEYYFSRILEAPATGTEPARYGWIPRVRAGSAGNGWANEGKDKLRVWQLFNDLASAYAYHEARLEELAVLGDAPFVPWQTRAGKAGVLTDGNGDGKGNTLDKEAEQRIKRRMERLQSRARVLNRALQGKKWQLIRAETRVVELLQRVESNRKRRPSKKRVRDAIYQRDSLRAEVSEIREKMEVLRAEFAQMKTLLPI